MKKETDQEKIEQALYDAIWIMRKNKQGTELMAVLSSDEADYMVEDIQNELNKAGFEIVKKKKGN